MKKKDIWIIIVLLTIATIFTIKKEFIIAKLSDYFYQELCIDDACFKKPEMYIPMFQFEDGGTSVFNIDVSWLFDKGAHKEDYIVLVKNLNNPDNPTIFITAKLLNSDSSKQKREKLIEYNGCLLYFDEYPALFLVQVPKNNIEFHMYTNNQGYIDDIKENFCS